VSLRVITRDEAEADILKPHCGKNGVAAASVKSSFAPLIRASR